MKDILAIILAAGESKRMNSPKMLLPYKAGSWGPDAVKRLMKVNPASA